MSDLEQQRKDLTICWIVYPALFAAMLVFGFLAGISNDSEFLLYVALWFMHLFFVGFFGVPVVVFGRHRARFRAWEVLALILPFLIWGILMTANSTGKSLANLMEFGVISLATLFAILLRVSWGDDRWTGYLSAGLIAVLCGVGGATYWLMPGLPE